MAIAAPYQPTAQGRILATDAANWGTLRESNDVLGDWEALHQRMNEDGYVFLRDYLDRDDVLGGRRDLLERIAGEGGLAAETDLMDGILAGDAKVRLRQDLTQRSAPIRRLLKEGPMIAFFEGFLGGEVRPLDFVWVRSVVPGMGTAPHGDSVFMNRGTKELYTAWTPLGEIDQRLGGLIVLENSHRLDEIRESYGTRDVDTYCEDDPEAGKWQTEGGWPWDGKVADDPVEFGRQLGLRWLTATFRAGDLLIFTMHTLHGSLDNGTADRIRLSTDTRYQLASEPIDERWIGDDPIGHGAAAMKSIIC